MTKRTVFHGIAAAFLAVVVASASPAHAVPGWAEGSGSTSHPAHDCMKSAAAAIKAVTGGEAKTVPSPSKSANKPAKARGFRSDAGIFVYCYPNLKKFCDVGVAADYSVLVFSDKGKEKAGELLGAFMQAFKESKSVCFD